MSPSKNEKKTENARLPDHSLPFLRNSERRRKERKRDAERKDCSKQTCSANGSAIVGYNTIASRTSFFCRGNNSWLGARVPRTVLPTMQPSTKNALSDSHRKRNGSAIVKDWSSGSPLIDLALLKEARQNNDELAGALRSRTGIAKIRNIV